MSFMHGKLRKAIGAVKDQTSISIAKVASAGIPNLEVALVKATSHDEVPFEEKYVQELLYLTSCSHEHVEGFLSGIARRLNKTRNWIVALKTLMLLHRLLRDGDPVIEKEMIFAKKRGTRMLNVRDFRDDSHSNGWDFSSFVRAYGMYLDERLGSHIPSLSPSVQQDEKKPVASGYGSGYSNGYGNGFVDSDHDRIASNEPLRTKQHRKKPVKKMKPYELMEKFPVFQRLLGRLLACRPTGSAKVHSLVLFALHFILSESFLLYKDIRDGMSILLDAFFDMDQRECTSAFDLYSKSAKQLDDLISFYTFCKTLGVCRPVEYPPVEKISDELLETMEASLKLRMNSSARVSTSKRPKNPQARSVSFLDPVDENVMCVINGMKTLPPPLPPKEAGLARPSALKNSAKSPSVETSSFDPPKGCNAIVQADLLNLNEPYHSIEDKENKLALALFSGNESNSTLTGTRVTTTWETFSSPPRTDTIYDSTFGLSTASGWELALIDSESNLTKPISTTLAGGFDRLLLDSLYDQGEYQRKFIASVTTTGSASSFVMPGHSQSNFLALPAPPTTASTSEEDPFTASLKVPPPTYVQMTDLKQKQQLLIQEQQQWLQYQQPNTHGYNNSINYATNPFTNAFQPTSFANHFQNTPYCINYHHDFNQYYSQPSSHLV